MIRQLTAGKGLQACHIPSDHSVVTSDVCALQAAQWFAANELQRVRGFLDQHPGYDLLLVGHSLGAGD
jgi:hypothetical protein